MKSPSESEVGITSHRHEHNHDDKGKSLKEIERDKLSYNKLILFMNEHHPRKIVKDKDDNENYDSDEEFKNEAEWKNKTDKEKLEE